MLRFCLPLLLVLLSSAHAVDSLRIGVGEASTSDWIDILIKQESQSAQQSLYVVTVDTGWRISESENYDFLFYAGAAYFPEAGSYTHTLSYNNQIKSYEQSDVFEAVAYFKIFWLIDIGASRFRIGIGDGLSYVSRIPLVEHIEADEDRDSMSHLMNYIDFSIDLDIGSLLGIPAWEDIHVGYYLKHRSGVYGYFNDVQEGGHNYNMIFVERYF